MAWTASARHLVSKTHCNFKLQIGLANITLRIRDPQFPANEIWLWSVMGYIGWSTQLFGDCISSFLLRAQAIRLAPCSHLLRPGQNQSARPFAYVCHIGPIHLLWGKAVQEALWIL